jgi:hypothetical protein
VNPTPTPDDARETLACHVAAKGAEIREKYGPVIGWPQLQRILADRECVRYPCGLFFDAAPLLPGECAYPEARGAGPEDGFRLCVHPYFSTDPDRVPLLALYQIVAINYGSFASPNDAELFGASVLGIPQDEYYALLCAMADEISPEPADAGERTCGCDTEAANCVGTSASAAITKTCAH